MFLHTEEVFFLFFNSGDINFMGWIFVCCLELPCTMKDVEQQAWPQLIRVNMHVHVMDQSCLHVTNLSVEAKIGPPSCLVHNCLFPYHTAVNFDHRSFFLPYSQVITKMCNWSKTINNCWICSHKWDVYIPPQFSKYHRRSSKLEEGWRLMWNIDFWVWHCWHHITIFLICS